MAIEETEAKYRLERYKLKIGLARHALTLLIGGAVITFLPLEFKNLESRREWELSQEALRTANVQKFTDTALNSDIQVPLRMAEYFQFVSPNDLYQRDWKNYYEALTGRLKSKRDDIEKLEDELAKIAPLGTNDCVKKPNCVRVLRELDWAYADMRSRRQDYTPKAQNTQ